MKSNCMETHDLLTRLLRCRPLLLFALLFFAGCALEYLFAFSWGVLCLALGAVLLLILLVHGSARLRRLTCAALVLLALPLGGLRFALQWQSFSPLPEQAQAQLSGRICQTPQWDAEDVRTLCVLDDLTVDGRAVSGRIRLYLRGDEAALQSVELGQIVNCTAHIWQDAGASNPGQFDFANYLRLNGLRGYATAQIEEAALSSPVPRAADVRLKFLEALQKRVERLFPENPALARAFLLGDRSTLSDEERENYSRSGAAHLLAISGMHVSVLAAAVNLLLGNFLKRKWAYLVTLALMCGYAGLIGFSAALFRAVLMFAVFAGAPLLGRYSDGITRLAAAMLIYLWIRPIAAIEAGFLLSYGACAGIMLLSAPLRRLFHVEALCRSRIRSGLRNLPRRLLRWCIQMLITTAAAQLAILPGIVHFFGAQPFAAFGVNLLAVPLAMGGYLISILGLLTGIPLIAAVADGMFSLLNHCVAFFSSLPLASVRIARFPLWLCVICALTCILASDMSRLPERLRRLLALAVIPAALVSNLLAYVATLGFSVVFLDSGQADCALLRAGGRLYLVDTGDSYSPAADYLSATNGHLEAIFLSHAHTDHAGGLDGILDVCVPRYIYISHQWANEEVDASVAEALLRAEALGAEIVELAAGDQIKLSDETILNVLAPAAGISENSANEDSMILRIDYGTTSALFCGDAPAERLSELPIGDIDVLKVPHHGGDDSLSPALLGMLTPSVAIIPVGVNYYGHPAAQTLELLDAAEAYVCRLDQTGAVECRFLKDGRVSVRSYRPLERDYGLE